MTSPIPSYFKQALTNDRLEIISGCLLEEWSETEKELSRFTDDAYTRGCTTFGRQKNRILIESRSKKYPWLEVLNSRNDIVFTIGDVPCRISKDDPLNPSKAAILLPNQYQQSDLFASTNEGQPDHFCFVTDCSLPSLDESPQARIVFLGLTKQNEIVCRWVSDASNIWRVENQLPLIQSTEIAKKVVTPKRDKGDTLTEVAV